MSTGKHDDPLKKVMDRDDTEAVLYELAETFRVLGDLSRVRILMALVGVELCVRDIALGLELTDSAVSHQLRILRNSRLVKFRKDGKNVLYSISDDHVPTIFREGLEHVEGL
ncbi:MAG: metalloregulator ArsR/SmtB family transcription factor [bacterium]|nr:metalloregulator ArsR/SmtB family transcription factor [bacterium]MDT8395702.1 metalloregulator ArsR/SmtB family transcription factor [bacterium]